MCQQIAINEIFRKIQMIIHQRNICNIALKLTARMLVSLRTFQTPPSTGCRIVPCKILHRSKAPGGEQILTRPTNELYNKNRGDKKDPPFSHSQSQTQSNAHWYEVRHVIRYRQPEKSAQYGTKKRGVCDRAVKNSS